MLSHLDGALPEVFHRDIGGGRWATEAVVGRMRFRVALGAEIGVADANGVRCKNSGASTGPTGAGTKLCGNDGGG